MVRSSVFSVIVVVCAPMFTSCLQVGLDKVGTQVVHQRKDESVVHWKDRKVGKPAAVEYVGERTAVLVGGDAKINFEFHRSSFTMSARSTSADFSIGSAAAISPDGYYLTAAHCLNDKGLRLIAYTDHGLLYSQDVRTVWNGKDSGMDLALIHINSPDKGLNHFRMADASAVQPGVEVLAGGVGGLKQSQSGGEILDVRQKRGGTAGPWKSVVHSAPLIKGDSGGPVMNEGGKLVGITSTGGAFGLSLPGVKWVHSFRSGAVWVDQDQVQSMIAEDRRKPHANESTALIMKADSSRKVSRAGTH